MGCGLGKRKKVNIRTPITGIASQPRPDPSATHEQHRRETGNHQRLGTWQRGAGSRHDCQAVGTSDSEIVRLAPSACNTQPWLVEREGDTLRVYRVRKPGRSGIMPAGQVAFYNQIDLGIFCAFWTSAFSGVTSDTRRSCTRTPVRTGKRRWPRSINGSGTE